MFDKHLVPSNEMNSHGIFTEYHDGAVEKQLAGEDWQPGCNSCMAMRYKKTVDKGGFLAELGRLGFFG